MKRTRISTALVRRAYIVFACIVAGFAVVAIRILSLQTVDFDFYQKKVVDQLTTESTISPERGSIYDSNGELLATDITAYRIFISPSGIQTMMSDARKEKEKTGSEKKNDGIDREHIDEVISRGLSEILGVEYQTVMDLTKKKGSLDATVKRNVDKDTTDKVLKFISENKLGNVLYAEATAKRYYVYGDLATHVIGFTGTDGNGLYGLEYSYEKELAGTPGKYIIARDSFGNEMPYEYQSYIDAVDGYDLHTTLNVKIQSILEEQLESTYLESGSLAGVCGVVMNVKTGAVYAMATYPDFDSNNAWTLCDVYRDQLEKSGYVSGSSEYSSLRSELLLKMWSNKAITDTYIPGSTFKIITSAMGLETGAVKESDQFTCTGSITLAGTKIHCHKVRGHGNLNFAQGLQQSCNPILITVGQRVGASAFYDYVKNFGYLEKTGIDLPGEGSTYFWNRSEFNIVQLATASFGQNFKVSSIRHLTSVASVANGGYLVQPYLVDHITDSDGNIVWKHNSTPIRQVVSTSVCERVSKILEEGVAGDGGAKNAYVAGYRVAAKTGTSEKIGDNESMRIGSCVAYAPADDPEIAIMIVVDEPTQGSLYGSVVAAPYIANCLSQMLPYLGVEAKYTDAEAAKMEVEIGEYRGDVAYNAKTAIEKMGLSCEIVGVGTVVTAQVPSAGSTLVKENGKVVLYVGDEAVPENDLVIPNVVGMSASAANRTIINAGFNIRIDGTTNYNAGSGAKAIAQYPAANSIGTRGDVVTVTFRYVDVTD